MNKNIFISAVLFLTLFGFNSYSQVDVGVKLGVNNSRLRGKGINIWEGDALILTSPALGVYTSISISENFSVKAEIVLQVKGMLLSKYISTYELIQLSYFSFPLMANYQFHDKWSVNFGAEISYLNNDDDTEIVNQIDLGVLVGLNYAFTDKIILELRYIYGVTDVYQSEETMFNRTFNLSLGYRIFQLGK